MQRTPSSGEWMGNDVGAAAGRGSGDGDSEVVADHVRFLQQLREEQEKALEEAPSPPAAKVKKTKKKKEDKKTKTKTKKKKKKKKKKEEEEVATTETTAEQEKNTKRELTARARAEEVEAEEQRLTPRRHESERRPNPFRPPLFDEPDEEREQVTEELNRAYADGPPVLDELDALDAAFVRGVEASPDRTGTPPTPLMQQQDDDKDGMDHEEEDDDNFVRRTQALHSAAMDEDDDDDDEEEAEAAVEAGIGVDVQQLPDLTDVPGLPFNPSETGNMLDVWSSYSEVLAADLLVLQGTITNNDAGSWHQGTVLDYKVDKASGVWLYIEYLYDPYGTKRRQIQEEIAKSGGFLGEERFRRPFHEYRYEWVHIGSEMRRLAPLYTYTERPMFEFLVPGTTATLRQKRKRQKQELRQSVGTDKKKRDLHEQEQERAGVKNPSSNRTSSSSGMAGKQRVVTASFKDLFGDDSSGDFRVENHIECVRAAQERETDRVNKIEQRRRREEDKQRRADEKRRRKLEKKNRAREEARQAMLNKAAEIRAKIVADEEEMRRLRLGINTDDDEVEEDDRDRGDARVSGFKARIAERLKEVYGGCRHRSDDKKHKKKNKKKKTTTRRRSETETTNERGVDNDEEEEEEDEYKAPPPGTLEQMQLEGADDVFNAEDDDEEEEEKENRPPTPRRAVSFATADEVRGGDDDEEVKRVERARATPGQADDEDEASVRDFMDDYSELSMSLTVNDDDYMSVNDEVFRNSIDIFTQLGLYDVSQEGGLSLFRSVSHQIYGTDDHAVSVRELVLDYVHNRAAGRRLDETRPRDLLLAVSGVFHKNVEVYDYDAVKPAQVRPITIGIANTELAEQLGSFPLIRITCHTKRIVHDLLDDSDNDNDDDGEDGVSRQRRAVRLELFQFNSVVDPRAPPPLGDTYGEFDSIKMLQNIQNGIAPSAELADTAVADPNVIGGKKKTKKKKGFLSRLFKTKKKNRAPHNSLFIVKQPNVVRHLLLLNVKV